MFDSYSDKVIMNNSQLNNKQLLKTLVTQSKNMFFHCSLSLRSIDRDDFGHFATTGYAT